MTRIEFYVLPDADPLGRLRLACELSARAWQNGLATLVRCQDDDQAERIDALLWSFRGERFVPHARRGEDHHDPVLVAVGDETDGRGGLLVNLANASPEGFEAFERVIEVVNQHPEQAAASRANFRWYRGRGYHPETIKLPPRT